jgi:hypothetical protein
VDLAIEALDQVEFELVHAAHPTCPSWHTRILPLPCEHSYHPMDSCVYCSDRAFVGTPKPEWCGHRDGAAIGFEPYGGGIRGGKKIYPPISLAGCSWCGCLYHSVVDWRFPGDLARVVLVSLVDPKMSPIVRAYPSRAYNWLIGGEGMSARFIRV